MTRASYTALNIQYPFAQLILSGLKTIETRTYPITENKLNIPILLLETPGPKGKFKCRAVGIIMFTDCFKYKSKEEFQSDFNRHLVEKDSLYDWVTKPKYGWVVKVLDVFEEPIPYTKNKGRVFSNNINLGS